MTRHVRCLIFPGFQLLDAAGPIAAFEIAGRLVPGAYRLEVVAPAAGLVESSSGAGWSAKAFSGARPAHTLLIAGGQGARTARFDPKIKAHLRAAAKTSRLASICTGAFLLAEAGLLRGRLAATHWGAAEEFARDYPDIDLERDKIFTRSGNIWTSAGITAGIDLALALIAADLGEETAKRTARQLVVYRRRPGGQSQFSALLEMEAGEGRFGPLLAAIAAKPRAPWRVDDMANHAGMSPRSFARAFLEETGQTPAKAVERLRLEAAKAALEAGGASVGAIARAAGFGDDERLRRAFIRVFGQAPSAFKRITAARRRNGKPAA